MNLPNRLSLVRICIVPLIACIYLFPYAQFGIEVMELDFEFVSLRITNIIDFLDGYIARKHQLVTSFGKFIDPIADKLLINTMFLLFAVNGAAPIVPVMIMIWRDTIVDGLRMTAGNKGIVVAAGMMGKVKTVAQMLTIIVLLLNNLPFELLRFPMGELLLWFSMCVSVLSGLSYFMQLKNVIMETM